MYIIRYSEIGLKGKSSRRQMESRLVSNIKYALNTNGLTPEDAVEKAINEAEKLSIKNVRKESSVNE